MPDDAPPALGVGRMVSKKGFQLLVERLPELLERFPRSHWALAGGGDRLALWGYAQSLASDVRVKKLVYALAPLVALSLRQGLAARLREARYDALRVHWVVPNAAMVYDVSRSLPCRSWSACTAATSSWPRSAAPACSSGAPCAGFRRSPAARPSWRAGSRRSASTAPARSSFRTAST